MVNLEAFKAGTKNFIKAPFEQTCKFLGDNPHAAVMITCVVAGFRGIIRPIFTLMDKDPDTEKKKYAAFREGLTEAIAIPVYIATPFVIDKGIVERVFKDEPKFKTIKSTSQFLSVCLAAVLIPLVCNVVQPPVMKAFKNYEDSKKAKKKLDVTVGGNGTVIEPPQVNSTFKGNNLLPIKTFSSNKTNYGMRVGN